MDLRHYTGKYIDASKLIKHTYTYEPKSYGQDSWIILYVKKGTGYVGDPNYVLDILVNNRGKILRINRRMLRINYGSLQRKLPDNLEVKIEPLMESILSNSAPGDDALSLLDDIYEKERIEEEKRKKEEAAKRLPIPNYKEDPQGALNYFIECFRKRQRPDLFIQEFCMIYNYAKKNKNLPDHYLDKFLDVLLEFMNPNIEWFSFCEMVCHYALNANKDHHFDEKLEQIRLKAEGCITGSPSTEKFLKGKLLQELCRL